MAEKDIVGGIFGMSPEMYTMARDMAGQQRAATLAAQPGTMMNPSLAPLYAQAAQQGQLIGRAAGSLLGVEDPELMKIRDVQQMRTQFDVSTPAGLSQFAQALGQKGYTDLAMQAAQRAAELEQTVATAGLRKAQAEKAISGTSVSPEQLLTSGRYTPASVAKYQSSGNIADLVLSKEATGGGDGAGAGPGPVGKAGAYRDAFGQVYGGGEMKTVRQEFDTNEKLLNLLNKVTEDDVKKAESIIDWTTKEGVVKGAGAKLASDTVTAQTKIAASQLLKQIESLPPGSASNADMVAAMKDFPGYGSQAALAAWINRAKDTIQNNLNRQVEQFGFRQRVQATAPLDVTKQTEKPAKQEKAPKVIKLD
jgi:hypothetical protein